MGPSMLWIHVAVAAACQAMLCPWPGRVHVMLMIMQHYEHALSMLASVVLGDNEGTYALS
jgi:hypothetical protein